MDKIIFVQNLWYKWKHFLWKQQKKYSKMKSGNFFKERREY